VNKFSTSYSIAHSRPPPPNPKKPESSFIPVLEAMPQSYSSSFKNSKGSNYVADKSPGFPANSKEDRISVEDTTSFASKRVSF
jgi:hypothetical protein